MPSAKKEEVTEKLKIKFCLKYALNRANTSTNGHLEGKEAAKQAENAWKEIMDYCDFEKLSVENIIDIVETLHS